MHTIDTPQPANARMIEFPGGPSKGGSPKAISGNQLNYLKPGGGIEQKEGIGEYVQNGRHILLS
jgi:hypothetical protein